MAIGKCKNCGKEAEMHAKGFCYACYKKLLWKPKKGICKRCGREIAIHSKGLCAGCYNFVFHLEKTKSRNNEKRHNIDPELYNKITKSCALCGFDKIVDLHHLDSNPKNNDPENLVGLCPNHHKMFHDFRYRKEIQNQLREKGFHVPEDLKISFEERK